MTQPILFTLHRPHLQAAPFIQDVLAWSPAVATEPMGRLVPLIFKLTRTLPVSIQLKKGQVPPPGLRLLVSGVTKDSGGAALSGCTVTLYRSADNVAVDTTVSGADGSYSLSGGGGVRHYVVAYKAGSPDVAGTTVNTLYAM